MKRKILWLALALLALVSMKACIFGPTVVDPDDAPTTYVNPSTPESVVVNLEVCYRRREIEEYGKLLHPQFEFEFQDSDVQEQGERLNRDQDSTGTRPVPGGA